MENQQYRFDFSFLKTSIWLTLLLAILKLADVIQIATIWVFSPILIAIALIVFVIFLIGLLTVYLITTGAVDLNKKEENDEKQEEES